MPSYEENIQILEELASLQPNWNDNGTSAFSSQHIEHCIELVERLDKQPKIFPAADSIHFQYNQGYSILIFEIFEGKKIEVFLKREGQKGKESEIPFDVNLMNQWITTFFEKEEKVRMKKGYVVIAQDMRGHVVTTKVFTNQEKAKQYESDLQTCLHPIGPEGRFVDEVDTFETEIEE